MEITISISDFLASQALAKRLPAEAFVEQLLGKTAEVSFFKACLVI